MTTYFYICLALFGVGLLLLGCGTLLREKLRPMTAGWMIMIGAGMAMIFMNLALILYMTALNR